MAGLTSLPARERRRRWSAERKRAIVAESVPPGAVVTETARRVEICRGQIYRWRRGFGVGNGFAQGLIAPATPAIGGESAGKARVRIPRQTRSRKATRRSGETPARLSRISRSRMEMSTRGAGPAGCPSVGKGGEPSTRVNKPSTSSERKRDRGART
jgi:transposase